MTDSEDTCSWYVVWNGEEKELLATQSIRYPGDLLYLALSAFRLGHDQGTVDYWGLFTEHGVELDRDSFHEGRLPPCDSLLFLRPSVVH